ncbi:unnamed protein product [Urochloa decumbens]|uniref:C2H2-type domain-containing protein n=1 Tax=Urochloa decumbens TaxID=240449 RepID=A0ABC8X197_9POAL
MMVVKGDVYYSDSDSDDDDVDRYVFLARQPAPAPAAGRHAEDDRGASSVNDGGDDDGDATADEGEPKRGGVRRKKMPLGRREILDAAPPPPKKKKKNAGVELIAPPPSGSGSETESESAPSPCGVRAEESGSEGSHGTKAHEHHRAPGIGGEAKNAIKKKKQSACVKRRRGPGCNDEDGDRAVTAAAKAGDAPPAATSKRFVCNLCERCFDSYRALGGHVLGHRKKARIAIAAAAACLDDVKDAGGGVIGNCKDENAAVEASQETHTSGGITLHVHKMAAAAARHGKANGGGGGDRKFKTHLDVAEHREDVGSGGHDDANGNKGNAIAASGKGFKTLASGSDGNVSKTMTVYKCKVCGVECPTGRALGGHMRKHRKPPALVGGGGEGRSSASPPTDDDCQIPLARMFGAETGLQIENKIGWV